MMRNLLYYHYVPLEDVTSFREEQEQLCKKLGLKGKVLVASEGINGCVSGTLEATQVYKEHMKKDPRFASMPFKEGKAHEHTFRKLFVKIRKEIITTRFGADHKHTAPYIEPEELKKWYEEGKDFVIMDTRNTYETQVGMFKGAIDPRLTTFQEFGDVIEKYADLKNKTIVTYCTGGVRCEKASALLKQKGFENVYQLHGGILHYGEVCGADHWEGECFVFDRRGSVPIDPEKQDGEISEEIKSKITQKVIPGISVGKIVNYYAKNKVAEVILSGNVSKGDTLVISGPTTQDVKIILSHFQEDEHILESASSGQDITFKVPEKVRVNDIVYLIR